MCLAEVGNLFQQLANNVCNEKECLCICGSDRVIDVIDPFSPMSRKYDSIMRRITLPSRGNFGEGIGRPFVLLMRLRQRLISAQSSLYSLVMRDVASGPEITDPSSSLEIR